MIGKMEREILKTRAKLLVSLENSASISIEIYIKIGMNNYKTHTLFAISLYFANV